MDDVFDLREFIFTILRRWRVLIVTGLFFCLLGGIYQGFAGILKLSNEETVREEQRAYTDSIQAYQQQRRGYYNEIENLSAEIERTTKYNANSLLMQIDPYNEFVSKISFYVDTGYQIMPGMDYQTPDKTQQILNLYLVMSQDGAFYEKMREALSLETEARYLREVISVVREESDTLTITVIGKEAQQTEQIANYMYSALTAQKSSIEQSAGKHSIHIVSQSTYTTVDLPLADAQKANKEKLVTLSTALTEKNQELTELKQPKNEAISPERVIKNIIKFMIFGFAGGVGVGIFLVFFMDVMDSHIRDAQELKKRFQMRYLGMLPSYGRKRRYFKVIDQWVERLEGKPPIPNEAECLELIWENLVDYIGQNDRRILLTGSVAETLLEKAWKQFCHRNNTDFSSCFFWGGNVCLDAGTVKKLHDCDGVVLVERLGTSTMTQIEAQIEAIKETGKNIYGYILVQA